MIKVEIDENRQLILLKKYYEVDETNKVVVVKLHYEKASDILNVSISKKNNPVFNDGVLENINNIIQSIPLAYKVRIEFDIIDYEEYNPNVLIESFNDTLEMNQYISRRYRQRKEFISSILVLIGIIILCFMVISKSKEWFGTGIRAEVLLETINIVAWVFVWEAASMLFLEKSPQKILALRIKTRVSEIVMLNNSGQIIANESSENVFGQWDNEGKAKRFSKLATLISSMALLFTSIFSFYEMIDMFVSKDYTDTILFIITLIRILYIVLYATAGIAGIRRFLGKNKGLSRFMGVYVIIILVGYIISIVGFIKNPQSSIVLSSMGTSIINLLYILGYIINEHGKKREGNL